MNETCSLCIMQEDDVNLGAEMMANLYQNANHLTRRTALVYNILHLFLLHRTAVAISVLLCRFFCMIHVSISLQIS